MFYNTYEFSSINPIAFQGLPVPYQNDDCLEFLEQGEDWFCYPKDSEVKILGDWECMWNPETKTWERIQ